MSCGESTLDLADDTGFVGVSLVVRLCCKSVSSLPSEPRTMAWRGSTIVLVALCLGLTVRADEYGEADGDATGASDAIGAL